MIIVKGRENDRIHEGIQKTEKKESAPCYGRAGAWLEGILSQRNISPPKENKKEKN